MISQASKQDIIARANGLYADLNQKLKAGLEVLREQGKQNLPGIEAEYHGGADEVVAQQEALRELEEEERKILAGDFTPAQPWGRNNWRKQFEKNWPEKPEAEKKRKWKWFR